jgi:pimeloyl-ACP methyl ester carboxylesterase
VVVGHSKGAELALVAASHRPDLFAGASAWSPSSHVWCGFGHVPEMAKNSTWTFGGQPLPFVPPSPTPPWYRAVLETEDDPAVSSAAIAIEVFGGPVVLVSGGDDRVWPSAQMSAKIVDRMRRAGRSATEITDATAGHFITPDMFDGPWSWFDPGAMRGSEWIGGEEKADRALAENGMAATIELVQTVIRGA